MQSFLISLLVFSVIGLAVESTFNGVRHQIERLRRGKRLDRFLTCRTWLWSILVFGLSAAIGFPLLAWSWPDFFSLHWLWRGIFYAVGIYAWEFFWGWLLESFLGRCPWQYRKSRWRIWRYIRPRYFAYWFIYGFALEWCWRTLLPLLLPIT